MDGITSSPAPVNEPNLTYAPGSPERAALETELKQQEAEQVDLTATIGGKKKMGGGAETAVVQPHDHQHVLGVLKNSSQADARAAVELKQQEAEQVDLTATIGGKKKLGGGAETAVVQPHDHQHVLGVLKNS
ncbi:MAG: hypothetical protein ACXVXE_13180, partial [Nocardioidaceae bacterium]